MLLPWLALVARACRPRRPPRATCSALSALFGLLLLAGHPESAAIVLFALAAYLGLRAVRGPARGPLARRSAGLRGAWLGAAFVGGLLLSAVVTIPVLELFRNGFSDPRGGAPPPASVLYSWIFPEIWSRPDKLFEDSPDPRGPFNYPERTAYLGALPALLALGGLAWRPPARRSSSSSGWALIALVIADADAAQRARAGTARWRPRSRLTRLLVVVTFAGAMLAAFGLQRLLDAPLRLRRRMLVVDGRAGGVAAAVACRSHGRALGVARRASVSCQRLEVDERSADVARARRRPGAGRSSPSAVSLPLRVACRLGPAGLGWPSPASALALTAFDLVTLNRGYHPQVEQARADPPAPAAASRSPGSAGSR